ncbi:flagellar basal-body rod protein FlgG [Marinivivus vitaminiproducens]|uniref:flagellar basal-body rod protein FlgG n=1 Tax=Marinivivus vitaminiproducens TaxID=3035935 RepID=UPI0027A6BA5E|nr:flagellar basal-body rod protein FlgG [Geminicoccaceae bacterium SCSIO 64248]
MKAMQIAATGMQAQQTRVNVIANNIANSDTTAYHARRAEFADLMYQQERRAGTVSSDTGTVLPTGVQVGLGVRGAAIAMDTSQGSLRQTTGDLDVAIEGRGYLEIALPDGTAAYTRDGALKRSPDGVIVTAEGYPVQPEITIPEDALQVSINGAGEVWAYFAGEAQATQLGRFGLATFINEKGLEARGGNLFVPTTASGDAEMGDAGTDGRGTLRQGYLEESSVDVVAEITSLIEAQRSYEMNSKVISAVDEMLAATNRVR